MTSSELCGYVMEYLLTYILASSGSMRSTDEIFSLGIDKTIIHVIKEDYILFERTIFGYRITTGVRMDGGRNNPFSV